MNRLTARYSPWLRAGTFTKSLDKKLILQETRNKNPQYSNANKFGQLPGHSLMETACSLQKCGMIEQFNKTRSNA